TKSQPFGRITDALALQRCRWRASSERGDILVAAGTHKVSYDAAVLAMDANAEPGPLVIDFPVRVIGATAVPLDADLHPKAGYDVYATIGATFLVANPALGPDDSQILVLIADTSDVTVSGLVLVSGNCHQQALCPGATPVTTWGGSGIWAVRS